MRPDHDHSDLIMDISTTNTSSTPETSGTNRRSVESISSTTDTKRETVIDMSGVNKHGDIVESEKEKNYTNKSIMTKFDNINNNGIGWIINLIRFIMVIMSYIHLDHYLTKKGKRALYKQNSRI